jgi:PST family polysaccharide transporter
MKRLPPDIIFESAHLSSDLAGKSVRGGINTMTAQGVRFVLQIAGTMILARLLTPNDYGLIAMVAVVVGFAGMFKDAGLSMATVQKDKITHEQISTLFWINVLISVVLGLCVLVGSPLIAAFYGKPELTAITAVLSISFIISGLSIQHAALLQRHMRFGSLAMVNITAQVITLTMTILLALYGWRYWALVGGSLTTALFTVGLTFFFCPWVPSRMQKGTGVRNMLKFGGHLTGFNFINYFSRNLDNILIGKFIGADSLGLYGKAYQIVYLPLTNIRNPINAVAFPVLSKLQNDPERFRRYYGKIVFMLAFCSMPAMAFCIMFPEELIRLIFGEQWLGMKAVFRLLAIAGYTQAVTGTRGMLLLACGRSGLYFKLGAVGALLAVTGFGIGIFWGITGVAASFVVVSYVPQYHMFSIAFRSTPCTFRDLLGNCVCVAILTWLSVLCVWTLTLWLPLSGHLMVLVAALVMSVVYIGLFMAVPTSRRQLLETISLLRANRQVS